MQRDVKENEGVDVDVSQRVDVTITVIAGVFHFAPDIPSGPVRFDAGKRTFKVEASGEYDLSFLATNFRLKDPPIDFPLGDPDFLTLLPGYTDQRFTVRDSNSGLIKNQTAEFRVLKADGEVEDPTVVNNPDPAMEHGRGDEHAHDHPHRRSHGDGGKAPG